MFTSIDNRVGIPNVKFSQFCRKNEVDGAEALRNVFEGVYSLNGQKNDGRNRKSH